MTFGSLFSGIGMLDHGFELAGLECRWQVEVNPFCQLVLEKHWPRVRRFKDVRDFWPAEDCRVDVIGGGFPCQDISQAGFKSGIEGSRSGLWTQFARVLRILRPTFALIENSGELPKRGLDVILRDLAELGYDAEWHRLAAADFGAPHLRRRLFIVAYPNGFGCDTGSPAPLFAREDVLAKKGGAPQKPSWEFRPWRDSRGAVWASPGPGVHGMDDGPSSRLDLYRLWALGNTLVPQIAERFGQILRVHSEAMGMS